MRPTEVTPPTPQTEVALPARKLRAVLANYGHLKRRAEESVNLIAGPDVSPTVTPQPMATGRKALAIAFLLAMTLLIAPRGANAASVNLLNNGDFTHGSGSSCDGWRVDAWILAPTATEFIWIRPVGKEPGELEVDTHHDNDARWEQTVALDPGWYYFSVEARTEKILPFFIGATISVLEDSIMSADLKRTNGWTKLGFYLRVGPEGGDVDVALRIGGFIDLNRGKAFFRHASVVQVSGPPRAKSTSSTSNRFARTKSSDPSARPGAWSRPSSFSSSSPFSAGRSSAKTAPTPRRESCASAQSVA